MKAMVMREFGPPEVLRLEEAPEPVPGAGEVLIRVGAVSVNRTLDLAVRAGTYPASIALPHILGVDPSGVITALGPGVKERQVGERVVARDVRRDLLASGPPMMLGVHAWGGYAEYVKVPVHMAHTIPENLDLRGIAVIGTVGRASAADVGLCLEAAAAGRHRVLIDRVMPLAEAAAAHRIVAERSGTGKVVLEP
jgi:NADPH:quinone reductase-like Zn-dependent oxidoreductase